MSLLSNLINILQSQDIFQYYLPFLLTFSIFYALLIKSKIFGDGVGKKISLIVALIAGLYVTIATPIGIGLTQFFAIFFAQSTVFLTLIIVIAITTAALATPMFLGENTNLLGGKSKFIAIGIIVLVSLAMFASSMKKMPGFPGISLPGVSSDDLALGLLLVATGLMVWWAQRGEDPETIEAKKMIKRAKEEARKKQLEKPDG